MDKETNRREAIKRVALRLRNASQQAGKPLTTQQSVDRVTKATVISERKSNR